jgi:hypothetical protein
MKGAAPEALVENLRHRFRTFRHGILVYEEGRKEGRKTRKEGRKEGR